MLIRILPKSLHHKSSGPILQQTAYWGRVKEKQGFRTIVFEADIKVSGNYPHKKYRKGQIVSNDFLVVLRNIGPDFSMAYIPYGPSFDPGEEERGRFLEELSESLRTYLPRGCIIIRYDLPWESVWATDENRYNSEGIWMGPPDPVTRELRMNFDTKNRNLRKSPTDVLPSHTIFLDIQKDEENLLRQMKSKTRYNIRLALRKGIKVHELDMGGLSLWYDLYKQTAIRNNIALHDPEYFSTVLKTKISESPSKATVHLLLAEAEGYPLAAMFLAISGKRATYLYGASSSKHREMMGTYALQWNAIRKARKTGCKEYDLFGISETPAPSHPMYGLYRFKSGFGGHDYHRQGCWDYPFDTAQYEIYRSIELNSTGYHLG